MLEDLKDQLYVTNLSQEVGKIYTVGVDMPNQLWIDADMDGWLYFHGHDDLAVLCSVNDRPPHSVNGKRVTLRSGVQYMFAFASNEDFNIYFIPRLTAEAGGGEKIAEHISAEEVAEESMFARLRAEMLAKLSEMAGQNGMDTFDDEDDLDEDEDTSDAPLTPYEYVEMQEEYPAEPQTSPEPAPVESPNDSAAAPVNETPSLPDNSSDAAHSEPKNP